MLRDLLSLTGGVPRIEPYLQQTGIIMSVMSMTNTLIVGPTGHGISTFGGPTVRTISAAALSSPGDAFLATAE
jgi:hypothetical protein